MKQPMDLLKNHYEKILLSIVLLILAGTAVWLFVAIEKKREEVQVQIPKLDTTRANEGVNLAMYQKNLDKLKTPPSVDFSVPHHLFNPVVWKQRSDGTLFKIGTQDVPRLVQTKPLNLIISFDRVAGPGYYFGVERQAAPLAKDRKKVQRYVNEGAKSDPFTLKKVEGSPENPTGFILQLNDSGQDIVVTPSEPYKRVEGYSADLKYEVENRPFNDVRINSNISFGGEQYKVIAINENEVRVRAYSNDKQTTIKKTAP